MTFCTILAFLSASALTVRLTFVSLGPFLGRTMEAGFSWWTQVIENILRFTQAPPLLQDLILNGLLAGVGSVLSFLPVMAVLFFCLSMMEESGLVRAFSSAAALPLQKIGLSGEAAMPLLLGFGCSVPAMMAASEIRNPVQRNLTLCLIPFMSCSAKLPLYAMLATAFFSAQSLWFFAALYGIGMLAGLFCLALIRCSRTGGAAAVTSDAAKKHGCSMQTQAGLHPAPHRFRLCVPTLSTVLYTVRKNSGEYFKKIFTVVLAASILIRFSELISPQFHFAASPQESLLAAIGRLAAPLFAPLGFGDWRAAAALLTGLSAKEAIVSTLAILAEPTEVFNPLTAFSFAVFCLLYVPCIATLGTVKKVTGSRRAVFCMVLRQLLFAWMTAFVFYRVGLLFFRSMAVG